MTYFGPVARAAHGGQTSPQFELMIGLAFLALTWIGHFRKEEREKASLWIAVAITAICAMFIYSGIHGLLR
jgi:hypothetical protein